MNDLPKDLTARGFQLIARTPDRLYAVSERYGGTLICADMRGVVRCARALISFVEWYEAKERKYSNETAL